MPIIIPDTIRYSRYDNYYYYKTGNGKEDLGARRQAMMPESRIPASARSADERLDLVLPTVEAEAGVNVLVGRRG